MLGTFRNWADIVARRLAIEGIDLHEELARRGIHLDAGASGLGAVVTKPRLDRTVTGAIWRVVDERTADPVFGLSLARAVDYLDFEELGIALVGSGSVEAVLSRMTRYNGLLSDEVEIGLTVGDHRLELRIDHSGTHWRVGEFVAALVLRLLRVRFDPALAASVELAFDNPTGVPVYRRYFRGDVVMGSAVSRVVFDRAAAARTAGVEPLGVAERFDEILSRRAAELAAGASIGQAVEHALRVGFGTEAPTLDRIAAGFHLSARTLQRRLNEEGTTFAEHLDAARRASAGEWLREGRLSRTEIAFLLGFSHASSFSRALRRWFPQG